MTELEKCMESLIVIFHRYADEDSDCKTLSKKELKKLMECELPAFLKVSPLSNMSAILSTHQCNLLLWHWFHHEPASHHLCFRPRKTPNSWTKWWKIWTKTKMPRWTLKNSCPLSLASQWPVSNVISSLQRRRRSDEQIIQKMWHFVFLFIFLFVEIKNIVAQMCQIHK